MAQSQSKVAVDSPDGRLYYLDNFRTFLTALVIYHHVSIPYGGLGGWFYKSQFHTPCSSKSLVAFNAINQSYFMASFFFLSGHFSAKALNRKGAKKFLKTKLLKLGIPIVLYSALAAPAQIAFMKLYDGEKVSLETLTSYLKELRAVKGLAWFTATLLIFDTIYASLPNKNLSLEGCSTLPSFLLDISTTFLVRLIYPLSSKIDLLNLRVGYLPQYIASYTLGASLATSETPADPPLTKTTRNILLVSTVASTATGLGLLHFRPASYPNYMESFSGGANMLSLSYSVWNETAGYLLGVSILRLFETSAWLNRSWGAIGRYSYAAFLVHPVVCVGMQVFADGWRVGGVLKTAVVGTACVVGSWGVGWGLAGVPGLRGCLL